MRSIATAAAVVLAAATADASRLSTQVRVVEVVDGSMVAVQRELEDLRGELHACAKGSLPATTFKLVFDRGRVANLVMVGVDLEFNACIKPILEKLVVPGARKTIAIAGVTVVRRHLKRP
jgi:hypothetical protein